MSSVADNAFLTVGKTDFPSIETYFRELREKRKKLQQLGELNCERDNEFKELNSIIKDAQEENEFYYSAHLVRGFGKKVPEYADVQIPFVNFPIISTFFPMSILITSIIIFFISNIRKNHNLINQISIYKNI